MLLISKKKNIYKGSWWYNNKRKHPSIVIKSNNNNYYVVRTLSHSKERKDDFELFESPNPNNIVMPQYISKRKYTENDKNLW